MSSPGTADAEALTRALRAVVGPDDVLTDPDLRAPYCIDWTGRYRGEAAAVVRPHDTAQVSQVVRTCAQFGMPIVAQGGNTGLVGASVPRSRPMVIVSTRGLTSIGSVDVSSRQVTVGAGVTIAQVQRLAATAGLDYGVDLAARDSATIGGTVATNAGGLRVVRHGDTRRQMCGLEYVLADGSVATHLAGLPKDSAGFDVSHLMVASEGTLGLITQVRLHLVSPLPEGRLTTLVGVSDIDAAVAIARDQDDLLAAEFIGGSAMDLVTTVAELPFPLQKRWPVYLLIETTSAPLLDVDADAVVDRRLWAYRERQTEAVGTLGVVHKLDVGVPLDRLRVVMEAMPSAAAPHDLYVFGHLLEGNLHVEVVGAAPDDHEVDAALLRLVASNGGTISAEHGVGVAKVADLPLSRSAAELAAMRAIKDALDPAGLLNPGVLLPYPHPHPNP